MFLNSYNVSYLPTEKITFENAPNPQEFNEGDDADIVCDVVSSPPPTIIWKHKSSRIQFAKDGEPVQIKNVSSARALFSPPACRPFSFPRLPEQSPHLPANAVCQFMPFYQFATLFLISFSPAHHLWTKPCIFTGEVLDLIDDAWTWKLYFQPSEGWLLSLEKMSEGELDFKFLK